VRAARTAASTSSVVDHVTAASDSSVAGLMVLTSPPWPSTNSPPMNIWYRGRIRPVAADSGAGAYSHCSGVCVRRRATSVADEGLSV
jgi:hypothetical protein